MRQSKLFPKTLRTAPKEADNLSTALLMRGGFIVKLMAGSYSFTLLGWRVMQKIEAIIRREMDVIGGQEVFLPTLTPDEVWKRSGRWEKLAGDMYQFKDPSDRPVGLTMTHEEIIMDLFAQHPLSYNDLPVALYQFQTKYRYEPRAKSGLLRAREFIMKDLYSVHPTEADLDRYYKEVEQAYLKVFQAVDVPVAVTLASGGVFTPDFSHEFQSICEVGEDTIHVCPKGDYAFNKELIGRVEEKCPTHGLELETHRAVEVGNIFKLGQKYPTDMKINFTDEDGVQKPFWFASYGIGLGRLMSVIVEHHHDEQGMQWPATVAPYQFHLVDLSKTAEEKAQAEALYSQLTDAGLEVLYDDRAVAPGVKFADADLLGMPYRLVISPKTLVNQSVELKARGTSEIELLPIDALVGRLHDLA